MTGYSSGIGLAFTSHPTVLERYDLVFLGTSNPPTRPDRDEFIRCDLSELHEVAAAMDRVPEALSGVVLHHGVLRGRAFSNSEIEDVQITFAVNVMSTILILKGIYQKIAPRSAIILYGSVSGLKGSYDDAYAASKGAVHALVRSLALKFAGQGIRCIAIAPGMTNRTRMTTELVPGRYDENLKSIPLGHATEPQDLAELTLFLLSEHAKSMTGAILDVNGGQYLR